MSDLSPAARLAALLALQDGLGAEIAKAKRAVLEAADEHDVKAFTTPWGPVNIIEKDAPIVLDEAAFTAWVEATRPDEIVVSKAVRGSYRKVVEKRLVAIRGEVVDTATGEVVPWATVGEPPAPYASWPATTAQADAKAYARLLFEDRAAALTAGLVEITR